jgi:hypothetical protein
MDAAVAILIQIVVVLSVLVLAMAHWRGWMTPARSSNFIFALVSLVAVAEIAKAITKVHQPYLIIACLVGMWILVLQGRRTNANQPLLSLAVLLG